MPARRFAEVGRHQHKIALADVLDEYLHFSAAVLARHLEHRRLLHDLQLKAEGALENSHNIFKSHDYILLESLPSRRDCRVLYHIMTNSQHLRAIRGRLTAAI